MTEQFPNLEDLRITGCLSHSTVATFVTLLSGLKQLKQLYLKVHCEFEDDLLQCFRDYGNHLKETKIFVKSEIHPFLGCFGIWKKAGGSFNFFDGHMNDHDMWF